MRKMIAWYLVLAATLLLCACESPAPRKANRLAETTAFTQTTEATANPEQETTANPEQETTVPEITEPQSTTPATTAPETTEPPAEEAPQIAPWKTAYLEFLKSAKDVHGEYALVYIDGDDIPELYLNGDSEATGDAVCTYKNGKVIEQRLNRTWGGSYIPKAGLVKNTNGNMGYYTTEIYKLTGSGFKCIWSGHAEEEYSEDEEASEEYEFTFIYFIGDQQVSEEEYYAAIDAIYDTSREVDLFKKTVSYKTIRQQILDS